MRDLVVIGIGELGRLYGGAALRAGVRVTPVTRETKLSEALPGLDDDVPILVAVGETALDSVLQSLPEGRRGSVLLLQNELFPEQWKRHSVHPTVFVPWLLKKKGKEELVARATPVWGRNAKLVRELHDVLSVPCEELSNEAGLHQALVDKYTFILTVNALGLARDRTLGTWLQEDPVRVGLLAREAARLGSALCAASTDDDLAVLAAREGMQALSSISARGRTAQQRVARAIEHAARLGVAVPELKSILEDEARP